MIPIVQIGFSGASFTISASVIQGDKWHIGRASESKRAFNLAPDPFNRLQELHAQAERSMRDGMAA